MESQSSALSCRVINGLMKARGAELRWIGVNEGMDIDETSAF